MRRKFVVGTLLGSLAISVHAQESDLLEEVTVRTERSIGVLRQEAEEAQMALYDAFNGAIDERRYEIECDRRARIGWRVGFQVCYPAYVRILQSEATWRAFSIGGFNAGNLDLATQRVTGDATSEIVQEDRILQQKMLVAVQENPEVYEALLDYQEKKRAFDEAVEARSRSKD